MKIFLVTTGQNFLLGTDIKILAIISLLPSYFYHIHVSVSMSTAPPLFRLHVYRPIHHDSLVYCEQFYFLSYLFVSLDFCYIFSSCSPPSVLIFRGLNSRFNVIFPSLQFSFILVFILQIQFILVLTHVFLLNFSVFLFFYPILPSIALLALHFFSLQFLLFFALSFI